MQTLTLTVPDDAAEALNKLPLHNRVALDAALVSMIRAVGAAQNGAVHPSPAEPTTGYMRDVPGSTLVFVKETSPEGAERLRAQAAGAAEAMVAMHAEWAAMPDDPNEIIVEEFMANINRYRAESGQEPAY